MKRTVLSGVAWVASAMTLARVARYIALLILAGLLSPREFGLFAALYVIVDGLVLLQGFGIGHALIYRQERTDEAADTAFLFSLTIGILLLAFAWLLAPTAERLFSADGMTAPLRACSIVLIVHALRLVPFRLVEKALHFEKKLVPALSSSVAYLVVPRFVRQGLAGEPVRVYGDGSQRRGFCDVRDAAVGMVSLMEHPQAVGEVFNLGSSREVSILDLARTVLSLVEGDAGPLDDRITLVPYEEAYAPGFEDLSRRQPDLTKIQRLIGWRARISLEETLRAVIADQRRE